LWPPDSRIPGPPQLPPAFSASRLLAIVTDPSLSSPPRSGAELPAIVMLLSAVVPLEAASPPPESPERLPLTVSLAKWKVPLPKPN
jgi:hypothetical protein